MKKKNLLALLLSLILLVGCGGDGIEEGKNTSSSGKNFSITQYDSPTLTIVAGSENKVLEPIIEKFAKETKTNIQIDYLGSLDIMNQLQSGQIKYDAVWPASSIWLTLGDQHRMLKNMETTSISPIAFGIEKPLAEELGFVGRNVKTQEIIDAIASGKLKFTMTSATQSNSGASAYLGFLTAIAQNPDGLSSQDLANPKVQEKITTLLSGVNRSSGSSNWLVDLYLKGGYNAMVNYETLIIQTNMELEKEGRPPLYLVYPIDGLSISDSPLAFVDQGDPEKEEIFLAFQKYLLSDEAQSQIEKTGKRSAYGQVREENKPIYKKEWGIDLDKIISPVRLPKSEVIMEALNLYQSQFKKPALTIYVLDFSGSMYGDGLDQMRASLDQVLVPENAQKNLLLGTSKDLTYLIPFADSVFRVDKGTGNGEDLRRLHKTSLDYELGGGTAMYEGIDQALKTLADLGPDTLSQYSTSIVVLTDGYPNGDMTFEDIQAPYRDLGMDVPIFGILFGDASDQELGQVAEMSKARVFDGREDLIGAFRSVKGYN